MCKLCSQSHYSTIRMHLSRETRLQVRCAASEGTTGPPRALENNGCVQSPSRVQTNKSRLCYQYPLYILRVIIPTFFFHLLHAIVCNHRPKGYLILYDI